MTILYPSRCFVGWKLRLYGELKKREKRAAFAAFQMRYPGCASYRFVRNANIIIPADGDADVVPKHIARPLHVVFVCQIAVKAFSPMDSNVFS